MEERKTPPKAPGNTHTENRMPVWRSILLLRAYEILPDKAFRKTTRSDVPIACCGLAPCHSKAGTTRNPPPTPMSDPYVPTKRPNAIVRTFRGRLSGTSSLRFDR